MNHRIAYDQKHAPGGCFAESLGGGRDRAGALRLLGRSHGLNGFPGLPRLVSPPVVAGGYRRNLAVLRQQPCRLFQIGMQSQDFKSPTGVAVTQATERRGILTRDMKSAMRLPYVINWKAHDRLLCVMDRFGYAGRKYESGRAVSKAWPVQDPSVENISYQNPSPLAGSNLTV